MPTTTKHVAKPDDKHNWGAFIRQATMMLAEAEAKAASLRVSIEYFEKRKAGGEPIPSEEYALHGIDSSGV